VIPEAAAEAAAPESFVDMMIAYINEHSGPDPFRVREAVLAMRDAQAGFSDEDPRVETALKSMARTARALGGVCDYHLDVLWSVELKSARWWKRGEHAAREGEWKAAKRAELTDQALAEIDQIRWGF